MPLSSFIFASFGGGLVCFALAIALSLVHKRLTQSGQYLRLSLLVSTFVIKVTILAMAFLLLSLNILR